jgi:hypothetical protein
MRPAAGLFLAFFAACIAADPLPSFYSAALPDSLQPLDSVGLNLDKNNNDPFFSGGLGCRLHISPADEFDYSGNVLKRFNDGFTIDWETLSYVHRWKKLSLAGKIAYGFDKTDNRQQYEYAWDSQLTDFRYISSIKTYKFMANLNGAVALSSSNALVFSLEDIYNCKSGYSYQEYFRTTPAAPPDSLLNISYFSHNRDSYYNEAALGLGFVRFYSWEGHSPFLLLQCRAVQALDNLKPDSSSDLSSLLPDSMPSSTQIVFAGHTTANTSLMLECTLGELYPELTYANTAFAGRFPWTKAFFNFVRFGYRLGEFNDKIQDIIFHPYNDTAQWSHSEPLYEGLEHYLYYQNSARLYLLKYLFLSSATNAAAIVLQHGIDHPWYESYFSIKESLGFGLTFVMNRKVFFEVKSNVELTEFHDFRYIIFDFTPSFGLRFLVLQ